MAKFTPGQFEIKPEADAGAGPRVVKVETSAPSTVSQYQLPKISRAGEGDYRATKAKYGALAATDPDRVAHSQKDKRFSLSPLLRDPLSVEDEERRAIDERVRVRVSELAEEARQKAVAAGYQDGLKKGHDEAFEKFRESGEARLTQLDAMIAEFEGAKAEIYRANERFLMETVFRVGRMVLLRELSTDKEYLARLTRELVERVGVRENIRIRIHPDDAASIGMIRESLEKSMGAMKNLQIEVSPAVHNGGCQVETEWNAIDASIEQQLKGIYDAMIGGGT